MNYCHVHELATITLMDGLYVGETDAQVRFSDLAFQMESNAGPAVEMVFNRSGNRSLYGDVMVDYVPAQGKTVQVGLVRGVALYTPNTTRHFRMKLEKKSGVDFRSGKLHVSYIDQSKKAVKLAEEDIMLN